jgi:mannose-6-phosphate isomerase-like protein (cupin superfamily)
MNIGSWKRPEWSPLPYEGCVNVDGKVILWDETLGLAMLRFGEHGTIHEHPGESDTIVACLEGSGFTSVGGETAPLAVGRLVVWPKGVPHRLWTAGSTMLTLMVERSAVS